jgi:RND family efflux transporter MFP subunit
VRAVREATLSSRLAARIAEMPLAEGASFSTGALLVRFDCERQAAEARAAAAAVEVQKKTVDTNEELDKFESIGKNDLSVSRSVLDKAVAESDALKAQLKDCNVYAPFSGRVVERLAHSFEGVTVGQPLLRVVDTSALELDLIAPSAWLQWLAQGSEFQFKIDETGQTVPGTVLRLTPSVDPVSKTIRVIGQFQPGKAGNRVLPGMSGTALFPNQQH